MVVSSVVTDEFNVGGAIDCPDETHPPFPVDPDAVLPGSASIGPVVSLGRFGWSVFVDSRTNLSHDRGLVGADYANS